jgi:hypothetical protein
MLLRILLNASSWGAAFDPTTSTLTHMQIQANHTVTNPSCTFAGLGTNRAGSNLNPATGVATAPHPTTAGSAIYGVKTAGLDGKMYVASRNSAKIAQFDVATNTWVTHVGTGAIGSCVDGTLATSCPIDTQDVFVNAQSQIYFVDKGRIRTVDSDGKVLTLAGQSYSFGDGGLALSARFNSIYFNQQRDTGEIIVLDFQERLFREFSIGGNIQTIAGNSQGGTPNTSSLATTQPIEVGASFREEFSINPTNGDIYYNRGYPIIGKLDRATQKWVNFVGGGANDYFNPATDGMAGTSIKLYGPNNFFTPKILGFDGTSILAYIDRVPTAAAEDSFFKLYRISDGLQTHLAGTTGAAPASICTDGTATTSCGLPTTGNNQFTGTTYDTTGTRWLALVSGSNKVRSFTIGGNVGTLLTLPSNAYSFAYRRTGGSPAEIVYYCSTTDGKLHKHNMTTDTTLAWPVTSMACSGKSLIYNSTRNSLIFTYSQNGLMGVAEYLNP